MIHVIATITVKDGTLDDFLHAFHELMPKVLAEDGCIEYGPALEVETPIGAQAPVRLNTVIVIEKWRDVPALEAHLEVSHMADHREATKDFVESVVLQVLRPA